MNAMIRFLLGCLGGIVATGPMTMAMIELHRRLRLPERHALPPREITAKLVRAAGLDDKVDEQSLTGLTLINHFAYGGAAGALYSLAIAPVPGQPLLKGGVYGLLVWTLSYLGLLPALNVLKPATKHAASRNALMIAVHLVWGTVLAIFVDRVLKESVRPHSALAGGSFLPHRDVK